MEARPNPQSTLSALNIYHLQVRVSIDGQWQVRVYKSVDIVGDAARLACHILPLQNINDSLTASRGKTMCHDWLCELVQGTSISPRIKC